MTAPETYASIRYIVDDVQAAIDLSFRSEVVAGPGGRQTCSLTQRET